MRVALMSGFNFSTGLNSAIRPSDSDTRRRLVNHNHQTRRTPDWVVRNEPQTEDADIQAQLSVRKQANRMMRIWAERRKAKGK
jgi:hypothetical protein